MRISLITLIILLNSCFTLQATATDWPQFLGPHRNGISDETGLIDRFPDAGPEIQWRTPLGVGMSGLVIHEGVAFTMYQNTEQQFVVALNAATGKKKWETPVAAVYKNSMGNGPRATPTVHQDAVYSYSGEGVLTALVADSGKVRWSVDTTKQLAGKPAEYGIASSPLIINDMVVVQVGSPEGTVAAYDLKTGKPKWTVGRGASGYSSPVLLTLAGKEQIVALVGAAVMGIDPVSGQQLWEYPYVTEYNCNTASPVQVGVSSVLISAGENHGSTILKVTTSGKQSTVKPTWKSLGKESVLRAEWQTPVLVDGHLFALDNIGSAGPITNLVCVNLDDGKQVWQEKRFGKSNLTLGDGKLFISTMKGELVIVKASPTAFSEIARAKVLGMTRQAPVIANGRLYLRDDKEVVCIDVRAKK